MKALLLDMCVDQRHAGPAFLATASGAYITDWIAPDADDADILALARSLDRILVTEDADFGDLIYRDLRPAPPGVIWVLTQRIAKPDRARRLALLAPMALAMAQGHFVVAGPAACRRRPLP